MSNGQEIFLDPDAAKLAKILEAAGMSCRVHDRTPLNSSGHQLQRKYGAVRFTVSLKPTLPSLSETAVELSLLLCHAEASSCAMAPVTWEMGTYITGGMMPSWIHSLPPMYGASGRLILWRFDQMQKVLAAVKKIQQCIIH